jgi:hypothetical protein
MNRLPRLLGFLSVGVLVAPAWAQQIPSLPAPVAAAKGETVNISVQSGGKASLSFGSSTSFGTNVNLSSTSGSMTSASGKLKPASGSLNFSIGGVAGKEGQTSAVINNLRASGAGSATDFSGTSASTEGENTSLSSGNATLTGVIGKLDLTIDPGTNTQFSVETRTTNFTPLTTRPATPGPDGEDNKTCDSNASPNICSLTQVSSGSASAIINSSTNADINTSSYQSTFSQTF